LYLISFKTLIRFVSEFALFILTAVFWTFFHYCQNDTLLLLPGITNAHYFTFILVLKSTMDGAMYFLSVENYFIIVSIK